MSNFEERFYLPPTLPSSSFLRNQLARVAEDMQELDPRERGSWPEVHNNEAELEFIGRISPLKDGGS